MLCCVCKEQEATVHLTQVSGELGQKKIQQVHLCEECAERKGVNDPTGFPLVDLFDSLKA